MASVLDAFNGDSFSEVSLTAAINELPFIPGRIGQLGLFNQQGIATTKALIELRKGKLKLLQTSARGAPGTVVLAEKRDALQLNVPQMVSRATIYADEVQNVRAFGGIAPSAAKQVIDERLAQMARDHDATLEHLMAGAVQGQILDADGSTLFNLFSEFGVSQQTQSMVLSTAGTDVRALAIAAVRLVEDELGGTVASGYRALCGREFFDALIAHANVKTAYERWEAGGFLRSDPRAGFLFGGILWEEYRGQRDDGSKFLATGEAYLFPEGTDRFQSYFAPADFMETVNTIGLPRYARQAPDPLGRFTVLHTQSNPLPLCLQPRIVVKLTQG